MRKKDYENSGADCETNCETDRETDRETDHGIDHEIDHTEIQALDENTAAALIFMISKDQEVNAQFYAPNKDMTEAEYLAILIHYVSKLDILSIFITLLNEYGAEKPENGTFVEIINEYLMSVAQEKDMPVISPMDVFRRDS
jgi:hypothetical protein